ncbi:MAG: hypothetical protein R3F43_29030 [bacterium]
MAVPPRLDPESLAVVRWEAPPLWDRLGQRLAGLTLDLALEGERFAVRAAAGDVRVGAPDPGAPVRLETDRATIAALLAGRRRWRTPWRPTACNSSGTLRGSSPTAGGAPRLSARGGARCRASAAASVPRALEPAGTSRPG